MYRGTFITIRGFTNIFLYNVHYSVVLVLVIETVAEMHQVCPFLCVIAITNVIYL